MKSSLSLSSQSNKFRNSEQMAREGISIPIDPNLSKKDVLYIIKTLNEF